MKRALLGLGLLLSITASAVGWPRHGAVVVVTGPVLSAQSAQPMGWSDVRGFVSTDTASGMLYAVVQPAATANPSAAQIKTCKDGSGATAVACTSQAISSSGAKGPIKLGSFGQGTPLTSMTSYKVFFVHNSGSDSNIVNSAFTTKGKLTINATDGTGGSCGHRWIDNPNLTQWNAIRANVLQFFQNVYSPQIDTIFYIEFGWQCLNTTAIQAGAAAQSQYYVNSFTYNTATTGVRDKILALTNLNSFQASAFSHVPTNDPTTLGNAYWFSFFPACALQLAGFVGPSNCAINSQTGWTAYANGCWDLTVDGASRDGSGCYVLWGVIHHEVSEVLGRVSGWNNTVGMTLDIFRYGSSGNVKTSVGSGVAYPSTDNGATSFYGGTSGYNNASNCNTNGGGDCADLDGSVASAFNSNASTGLTPNPPLPGDFQLETIQGYYLTEKAMTCAEGTCTPF